MEQEGRVRNTCFIRHVHLKLRCFLGAKWTLFIAGSRPQHSFIKSAVVIHTRAPLFVPLSFHSSPPTSTGSMIKYCFIKVSCLQYWIKSHVMWRWSHLFYAFVKENPDYQSRISFYNIFGKEKKISTYPFFLVSSECFCNSSLNRCLVLVAMVKEESDAALIIIQQKANWSTIQTVLKGRLARLQRLQRLRRSYFICRIHVIVTLSVYIFQSYFFNSLVEDKTQWASF